MTALSSLATSPDIEPVTDDFPLLGYTVIAALGGVAVRHDELRRSLASLGLELSEGKTSHDHDR